MCPPIRQPIAALTFRISPFLRYALRKKEPVCVWRRSMARAYAEILARKKVYGMPGYGIFDPLERLCERACCREKRPRRPCGYPLPDASWPGCGCRPPRHCSDRCDTCPRPCDPCREIAFWPCWNSEEAICCNRPKPRCPRCGCRDRLERQGRYVRCCACGWIGVFEECFVVVCGLRSCCDNVFWPEKPGRPRY